MATRIEVKSSAKPAKNLALKKIAENKHQREIGGQNATQRKTLSNMPVAAGQHIIPDADLINKLITSLINRPAALKETARHLLHGAGFYAGDIGEPTTDNKHKQTLFEWIEIKVFAKRLTSFIIDLSLAAAEKMQDHTNPRLLDIFVVNKTLWETLNSTVTPAGDTPHILNPQAREFIFQEMVLVVMPTLGNVTTLADPATRHVGSVPWSYWHVGLTLLRTLEMRATDFSVEETQDLARCLEAMIFSGAVPASLIPLFQLPAILHSSLYSARPPSPLAYAATIAKQSSAQDALDIFFADSRKYITDNDPFIQFRHALDNYKTRTDLARELLTKYCRVGTGDFLLKEAEYYKINPAGHHCIKAHPRGAFWLTRLPDLNEKFNHQNKKIAELYQKVDLLTLMGALDHLAKEENLFLQNATISRFSADMTYQPLTYMPLAGFGPGIPITIASLPAVVDLIAASNGTQERIYALERNTSGYAIKRVDRHRQNYLSMMTWTLRSHENYGRLNFYRLETMKQADQPYLTLIRQLVDHHHNTFMDCLYQQGHDPTTRDKVINALYSLIPFYDCISELRAGEHKALLSCAIDIIGLMPLIGQTGRIGSRVLIQLGMGGNMALRASLVGFSARQSLAMALKAGAKSLAVNGLSPAMSELNRRAFIALAMSAARALDPGIELTGLMGKATLKGLMAGADVMKNQIDIMNKILPELKTKLLRMTSVSSTALIKTGRVNARDEYISVIKLAGDKYKNKDVYVRINPETGEVKGKKYIFRHDGTLRPVKLSAAKNLRNILTVGLSGRGAGNAVRLWNSDSGHSSLKQIMLPPPDEKIPGAAILPVENIVHIVRYGMPESEALLFPEFGIALSQEPLNLIAYETAFYALPDDQISAIRQWTQIENCDDKYSDLASEVSNDQYPAMSTAINQNLMDMKPFTLWDPAEKFVYDHLLSAFSRNIPTHRGEYLRVARYAPQAYIPWGDIIGPGDIVTNFPAFMSVSSEDGYAIGLAQQTGVDMAAGDNSFQTLIFYKIDLASQCLPLVYPIASLLEHEQEYLYKPRSFFKVKSISTGYHVDGPMLPHTRIAVVLEELPMPKPTARNLFTGETFVFDTGD